MHLNLLEIALDGRASGGRSRADVFCVALAAPPRRRYHGCGNIGYVRVTDTIAAENGILAPGGMHRRPAYDSVGVFKNAKPRGRLTLRYPPPRFPLRGCSARFG